jgi:uncharacterized protein (TIGR02996 family)
MERQSLYAAICASPRDDLPKLVFADWLEEHGNHVDRAHAELIRIQCEWDSNALVNLRLVEPYRLDVNSPHCPDAASVAVHDPPAARAIRLLIRATELELLAKTRPVMPLPEVNGASYRYVGPVKGFRTGLKISLAPTWYNRLAELRSCLPIRHLVTDIQQGRYAANRPLGTVEIAVLENIESLTSFHRSSLDLFGEILASPHTKQLRQLSIQHGLDTPGLLETLATREHLDGLEELELLDVSDRILGVSMGAGWFQNLRKLRLASQDDFHQITPAVDRLVEIASDRLEELDLANLGDASEPTFNRLAGLFPRLTQLKLAGSGLTGRSIGDLMTSQNFPELRQLNVSNKRLVDFVGKTLEKTFHYPRLHSLDVSHCQLSPSAIASLVRWPGLAHLRKLVLAGNPLNHQAIAALGSADAPNLRTLSLLGCQLHGSHIRELVTSRFVRSLWLLELRANLIDDAFVRALIETPFLDALQCLLLDVPEESPDYLRLKARFGDRFHST